MALVEIKKITLSDGDHGLCDEYARRKLEGLSNVYSISCQHEGSSSNTYVDFLTGEAITYSTMAIANTEFASASESITISKTTGKTTYIVLTSKTPAGAYYAVKFLNMNLGDTVYVIESKVGTTTIPDRWLSSYTADTSATFTVLDSKIDLKEYAKKTEAAKPGSYTTTQAGAGSTGSAGAQTATGTATITYAKADSATGSAGAHTHSVSVSGEIALGDLEVTKAASGTATYTPEGSVSNSYTAAGTTAVVSSVSAELAATPTFSGTSATISISGSVTGTAVGDHTYTPEGTISAVTAEAHSHTVNAATSSFTAVTGITGFSGGSLNGATAKTVVTGVTAASLTGDTTFVKSITNWNGGTFSQGSKATLSYSAASTATATVLTGPTVSDAGVLSWNSTTLTYNTDASKIASFTPNGNDTFTAATCTVTGGSIGITGGTASGTVSVVPSYTLTPASLGTVGTGTITYMTGATLSAAGGINVTPTFTGTEATLAHTVTQGTFSGSTSYKPAGTVSKPAVTVTAPTTSVNNDAIKAVTSTFTGTGARLLAAAGTVTGEMTGTATEAGAHTHSIGSTNTSATGTASVAVSDHTHTISNHTHSVTINAIA